MLYELIMKYTLYSQECNNRFYFSSPAVGLLAGGAEDLAEGFLTGTTVAALKAFWTNVNPVDFHTITCRALYDVTDFFEITGVVAAPTNAGGEAVASSSALGFRSDRFQTGRNRGYKRVSGYGEQQVNGNTFNDIPSAVAVAISLNNLVTGGTLGELYGPRVLLLDRSAAPVYTLFATEVEQRLNMSAFGLNWQANLNVTTQRSRLPGHGT